MKVIDKLAIRAVKRTILFTVLLAVICFSIQRTSFDISLIVGLLTAGLVFFVLQLRIFRKRGGRRER